MPDWLDTHTDDGETTVYMPRIATIQRVFDGQYGLSWVFREDTEKRRTKEGKEYQGQIWKAHPDYTGPKFKNGDKVKIRLKTKIGSKGGVYRDVDRIEAAPDDGQGTAAMGAPSRSDTADQQAIGPNDRVPAEWELPRAYYDAKNATERASFERQGVHKHMTDVVVSLPALVESKVMSVKDAKSFVEDWMSRGSYLWNRHGLWDEAGDVAEADTKTGDEGDSEEQPDGEAPSDDWSEAPKGVDDLPWNPDEVKP